MIGHRDHVLSRIRIQLQAENGPKIGQYRIRIGEGAILIYLPQPVIVRAKLWPGVHAVVVATTWQIATCSYLPNESKVFAIEAAFHFKMRCIDLQSSHPIQAHLIALRRRLQMQACHWEDIIGIGNPEIGKGRIVPPFRRGNPRAAVPGPLRAEDILPHLGIIDIAENPASGRVFRYCERTGGRLGIRIDFPITFRLHGRERRAKFRERRSDRQRARHIFVEGNRNGIGAKVEVYANNTQQLKEVYASRGYQSSVSTNLIFGLGESKIVDSLKVIWNDNKTELITKLIWDGNWHQVLVFTRTKHGANRLCQKLEKAKITAAAIHGNKSQAARTRALANFKSGEVSVLVATDIAARGLDIPLLPYVINFELPNVPEDYVHRIGRTGRAGASGQAISLVSADEAEYVRGIEKLLGMRLESEVIEGFEPTKGPVEGGKKRMQGNGGRGGNGQNRQGNNSNRSKNRNRGGYGGGNKGYRGKSGNNSGGGNRD